MLIVVYLDQPKRIVVSINAGWNDLARGQLSLKTIPNNVRFVTDETICHLASDDLGMLTGCRLLIADTGKEYALTNVANLEFGQVPMKSVLRLSIPFTIPVDQQTFNVSQPSQRY
jgi:hypothetical protein